MEMRKIIGSWLNRRLINRGDCGSLPLKLYGTLFFFIFEQTTISCFRLLVKPSAWLFG